MASQYARAFNNYATTVAAPYSPGAGTLTVVDASGLVLAPGEWTRITTISQATGRPLAIYKVTAVSGNNLLLASAVEGTVDQALQVGDFVRGYVTAGALLDIQGSLDTVTSPYSPVNAGQLWFDDGTGFVASDPTNLSYDNAAKVLKVHNLQVLNPAASPGTAAGSDAAVINAIVTILRNAGLCS